MNAIQNSGVSELTQHSLHVRFQHVLPYAKDTVLAHYWNQSWLGAEHQWVPIPYEPVGNRQPHASDTLLAHYWNQSWLGAEHQ